MPQAVLGDGDALIARHVLFAGSKFTVSAPKTAGAASLHVKVKPKCVP
jgi:hypothetical protein